MSRLFSGTRFEQPIRCDICGKYIGAGEGCCRCIKSDLPAKKTMGERAGKMKPAKPGYELTPENSLAPKDQAARLRVEKRKGNREVTVMTGLEHPANDLPKLLTELKTSLGCGGSVQGRTIELQGDHAAKAAETLNGKGIRARAV
jgi:translation initiation factor 1